MKKLLYNANILKKSSDTYSIEKGYIGIEGATIDYVSSVSPELEGRAYDEKTDMKGMLVMPGLINTHGHSAMTLLRGVGSGLPLNDWLFGAVVPLEDKMGPDDIYSGTMMAVMEMLSSGTTAIADMYDFPYAAVAAYAESGIKANVTRAGICFNPETEACDLPRYYECRDFIFGLGKGAVTDEAKREISKYIESGKYADTILGAINEGRIKANFSLHSEYLTSERLVRALAELNREAKVKVHVHVSETKKEHEECISRHGCTPVQYLKKTGIMDFGGYFAHCVWCEREDFEIMAESGFSLAHCPSSNLKLTSGVAPVAYAEKLGVNISLGTDGCASNDNLNMFEEMHLASMIADGEINPQCKGLKKTDFISAATVGGAKALGREDCGVIAPGFKADIIALDMSGIHMIPVNDAAAIIKYSAQASDVKFTMVDGKVLYKDGEFLMIDKERVLFDFLACHKRICG